MSANWYAKLLKHPRLLPPATRAKNGAASILAVLEQYSITERLATEELASQQAVLLQALVTHCAVHSPHFTQRLAAAGLTARNLTEPGGFRRLPPLTRRELVEARESLFCRTYPSSHGRVSTTSTSGSTGEPVTVRRPEICQLHWMANTFREHLWHDRDFGGRLAVVRANATEPLHNPDWGSPCSLLVRSGPAYVMPPSRPIEELVRWLVKFDPHELLILPSLLAEIVPFLERAGQPLKHVRSVRTLSETVSVRLREEVRRVFGREIHDVYSSQEGGVIATQCPEAGRYHVAETILLEVVNDAGEPCAPGEVGRILITDLINFATPIVRYEIGDYAQAGLSCSCGRGLPTIERFLGRERGLVLLPNGSRHWPTVGFHRWHEAYPIKQFQFTQLDREIILAKLFADGRPNAEQESLLTAIIQESLGHPFAIQYLWQKQPLSRGPGGKFEEFVCLAR